MREERAGRKGNGNTAGHKIPRTEGWKNRLWKNSLRENGLWETGLWKAACLVGMAALLTAGNESLMLTVYAEPAALRSAEATVYEQAGEGSNPVGNLVEGSTFDYIGDVTAEDGSVWHQITTSNGTTGYIRGDREIETGVEEPGAGAEGEPEAGNPEGQTPPEGEAAPENPEGQNPPEGEGAVENPEGQNPAEGQVTPPEENGGERTNPDGDRNGAPGQEEDNPEEDDPDSEDSDEEDPDGEASDGNGGYGVENHRTKSYSMGMTGRIKGKEDAVPAMKMDTESLDQGKSGIRIDKTLFLGIVVIFFCAGIVHLCWKKISGMRPGAKEQEKRKAQEEAIAKIRKKSEKKKRSQKKKVRKK